MSFKGLQKSVARAPQQFRQKFNLGESTKDPVYIDAERRFQELETETKRLHDESKKYFEAINGMLNHQIEFSKAMTEIYKPISGRVSDPNAIVPSAYGNPEGIRACEEYEAVVKDLQETLAPELEMIDSRVIRPANELLDVIKVIRKTAAKREHKKLDHDRHRANLKKLQDKKEKSSKDEKALWKAEGDVEVATQEFNYYNDLLKDELPRLFELERQFIQPLFQSFYYMQLNIFYTLHEKMQHCDIGYFDLTLDIEEAFNQKRGDAQDATEKLSICRFKTTGRPRPPRFGPNQNRPPALEAGSKPALLTAGPSSSSSVMTSTAPVAPAPATAPSSSMATATAKASWQRKAEPVDSPPPPYSPQSASSVPLASPTSQSLAAAIAAKSKPKPPPPKKPKAFQMKATETATALYDYSAQAEGDLTFRAGDVIEIVQRTDNENEWWTGSLREKTGQFPGNYVRLG